MIYFVAESKLGSVCAAALNRLVARLPYRLFAVLRGSIDAVHLATNIFKRFSAQFLHKQINRGDISEPLQALDPVLFVGLALQVYNRRG